MPRSARLSGRRPRPTPRSRPARGSGRRSYLAGLGAVATAPRLERHGLVLAVVAAQRQPLSLEVEQKRPFVAEDAQVHLERVIVGQRACTRERPDCAVLESDERRVIEVNLGGPICRAGYDFGRPKARQPEQSCRRVRDLAMRVPTSSCGVLPCPRLWAGDARLPWLRGPRSV